MWTYRCKDFDNKFLNKNDSPKVIVWINWYAQNTFAVVLDKWKPLCNRKHMSPLDPKIVNCLRELMGLKSVCIFMALEIVFSSSSSKKNVWSMETVFIHQHYKNQ